MSEQRTSAREDALSRSLTSILVQGVDDPELLEALSTLWAEEKSGQASPSALLSNVMGSLEVTAGAFRRADRPHAKLDGFLYFCAQADGFGCSVSAITSSVEGALINTQAPRKAITAIDASRILSKSTFAETIGLLLNEARPAEAPLWPMVCAVNRGDAALVARCLKNAGPLTEAHKSARDAMLILACETRDPTLFTLATSPVLSEPEDTALFHCAKALGRVHYHSTVRTAMGLDKLPGLDGGTMARMLSDRFPSPRVARALLREACLALMSLPESLPTGPWTDALKILAPRGASALAFADLMTLAASANQRRLSLSQIGPYHGFGPARTESIGSRQFTPEDFDRLAATCYKKALAPRSEIIDQDHPPLAYLMLSELPSCGPLGSAVIRAYLDKGFKQGFDHKTLAWCKSSGSGYTISVGSAVANLPRGKKLEPNFESDIGPWLAQLADQGFDFDAKATPKAKSLADRLRSPTMQSFWSLVESRIIARSTEPGATKKSSRSL